MTTLTRPPGRLETPCLWSGPVNVRAHRASTDTLNHFLRTTAPSIDAQPRPTRRSATPSAAIGSDEQATSVTFAPVRLPSDPYRAAGALVRLGRWLQRIPRDRAPAGGG
jgi:hypothetical protein